MKSLYLVVWTGCWGQQTVYLNSIHLFESQWEALSRSIKQMVGEQ